MNLLSPGSVAAVYQEHDGVHGGEIVLPHPPGLVMAAQIECGEPETSGMRQFGDKRL